MLSISYPAVLIAFIAFCVYALYLRFFSRSLTPDGLPWIGVEGGWLAHQRMKWGSMTKGLALIEEGYYNYSKKGRSCISPAFVGAGNVLVPPSAIKWIIDQPENILSSKHMQIDMLQTDYTLMNPNIVRHPIHEDVIRRDLTRNLGALTGDIMEELALSFDEYWGMNVEEWHERCVYDDMIRTVARTSNRIFVGLPLCRNDDYLDNCCKFAQDVAISGGIVRMLPAPLRPFLAWLAILPNRWHQWNAAKHLTPFVETRIASIEKKIKDPTFSFPEPNDYINWSIHDALKRPELEERTANMIVRRLMVLNFAAIHTSTFSITNVLFDVFSAPLEKGFVEGLREEIEREASANGGKWTKGSLGNMFRCDSAIRESMRLSGFLSQGLNRKVMSKDGLTMQDGVHLPCGANLSTSAYSIHHDQSIYSNAMEYDAFRFSRPREEFAMAKGASPEALLKDASPKATQGDLGHLASKNADLAEALRLKGLLMVTTGETYLPFGHGRHACPGRFFAANELKLLLAYIILNYDVKPIASRPAMKWVGGTILPPMKATISVKRRKPQSTASV